MSEKRKLCANCPWRKNAPAGAWPGKKFQDLARNCRDDGVNVMACHKSSMDEPYTCAGFLARVGYDSIGVRIQALYGGPTPDSVDASGIGLFETFEEMLEANGVEVPPRDRVHEV